MNNIGILQQNTDNLILSTSVLLILFICILFFKARNKKKKKKRLKIEKMREEINKKAIPIKTVNDPSVSLSKKYTNKNEASIKEDASFGIGVTLVSLYDIYASLDRHSDVIDVLEQRDPNVFSGLTETDLLMKFIGAEEDTISAWVSHYKGQEAENIALDYLFEKLDKELI